MRFFKGFVLGMILGGLLAWLYQHYFWRRPAVLPVQKAPVVHPPDDLAALHGVGPVFARQLQQAGIRTYADLARLTAEEVAERCGLPLWRIRRDDWIGQATARLP